MFSDLTPMATLPVSDLSRARKFYEETLGLAVEDDTNPGGVLYRSGPSKILVYPSEFAGTNKGTAVSFTASPEQFDSIYGDLQSKGVSFMTFDYEGLTWDGNVALMGDVKS